MSRKNKQATATNDNGENSEIVGNETLTMRTTVHDTKPETQHGIGNNTNTNITDVDITNSTRGDNKQTTVSATKTTISTPIRTNNNNNTHMRRPINMTRASTPRPQMKYMARTAHTNHATTPMTTMMTTMATTATNELP